MAGEGLDMDTADHAQQKLHVYRAKGFSVYNSAWNYHPLPDTVPGGIERETCFTNLKKKRER